MKHVITATLVAVLVAAHGLLGVVCGQVYRQYEALFAPGPELWALVVRVFGTAGLVAVAAGLVVVVVRAFWVIVAGFGLSTLTMVLVWGTSTASVALGLAYLVLALLYPGSVVTELNRRLHFSVRSVRERQGSLLVAIALLVGTSFGLGYREDTALRGFIAPPAFEETVMGIVLSHLQADIESRGELSPREKSAALEEANLGVERARAGIETTLRPYSVPIAAALALVLTWVLSALLGLLSRVPLLVVSAVLLLLERLGVTRAVMDTRRSAN